MANSVIPVKNGFVYQALYFWKKALEMFDEVSEIKSVSFELDEAKGFDDIVVEFKSEKYTSSGTIKKRFYQVKFHERSGEVIKCSDLILPSFINATKKSFLEKAKEAIDNSKDNAEVILINSWKLDQTDALSQLISNDDGSFDLSKLKEGKTAKSKMGKIRSEWANHLGINETELFSLLSRIKIQEGKAIAALIDDLNVDLKKNKLKKIDEDFYRDAPYISLIDDLHAKIKDGVVLDKKAMMEHFSRAKIFTRFTENNFFSIGIRSFSDGAEELKENVNKFLDLSPYFIETRFCDYEVWNNQIKNEIQKFVKEQIEPTVEYSVYLEAHQSIAFTLGYYAHQKTQKYLYPIQKGFNSEIWEYSEGNMHFENELHFNTDIDKNSKVVIINIDLMNRNLKNDVREYVETEFLDEKIDIIDIFPKVPEQRFVKDGNHCMKLAVEASEILQRLPMRVKRKQWRLIFTVPNSFIVFFGQHATQFGEVQLLEYDSKNFTYRESILL